MEVVSIILAAGKGKRMNSDLPKPLHKIAGKSLMNWLVDSLDELKVSKKIYVLGHQSEKLIKSGIESKEFLWRLPLGNEYSKEINSLRAEMKNIGSSRYGGSIHAAEFIKRFVQKKIPWAHIDIAGVSWTMKGGQSNITNLHNPGAPAFGVRLIDKFLKGK